MAEGQGPRLTSKAVAEHDAELATNLGAYLSEYLDDEAPLNLAKHQLAARRAIAKFGLIARNPRGV